MTPLSRRESQLLAYIVDYIETHNQAPLHTEMSIALELHKSTTREYLDRLIKKGYLVRDYGKTRGLRVTPQE